MKYFKIWPEYDQEEEHYAKWVDDSLFLMDFCVFRDRPLFEEWPKDSAFSVSEEGLLCDVLFNPNALFYSQRVRDAIEPMLGTSVEWLPSLIRDVGVYYVLHPLESVELGPAAIVKKNAVSKNYTWVDKYDFAATSLPTCFMIRQAEGSAARKGGFCMLDMIVNEQLRWKLARFRGVDFAMIYESPAECRG
jgi:hypothetical protein